tara:strand:+ start:53854 stop:54432 length:579 start_codon:yes stop_codon:yes gene_type:complete
MQIQPQQEVLKEPFLDLLLILDSSGSLTSHLYDLVSEGAKDALQVGNDDMLRKYAVINFSTETLSSGWTCSKKVSLQLLINNFQGAGSALDSRVLQELSHENERYATILVTDGMLYNPQSGVNPALNELKNSSQKGNRVGIIYIGVNLPLDYKDMGNYADIYVVNPSAIPKVMKSYTKFLLKGAAKPTATNF